MTELKNEQIPIVVSQKIEESKPGARKRKNAEAPIIPLFDETISHLSQDFFPNADLRSSIPQKLTVGTVMNFSGTARESGFSKATVFLQKLSESGVVEGEQTHFSGVVSGHNFSFPIMFLQPGKFYIGLVFDDSNKSRVGEIEVVSTIKKRVYPALESDFSSDLDIRLIPEEQKITLGWNMTDTTDISKITFTQKNKSKEIFIEDGISSIELLYSFFQDFTEGQPLAIELSQAFSRDGTLANQIMSWKPVLSRNYELVSGFPDSESEKISISHFPRYIKTLSSILLEGEIKEDVSLAENAFVIMPNGFVKEFPVEFFGNNAFRVQIQPEDWGRMIFELITDKGEILFNRAFYISKNYILPIGENNGVPLSTENVSGVRFWTNKFREIHGLEALTGSAQLNEFAQKYAEQMADENFISHITPTGLTFTQRLKIADFQGEYGENLSYATTLKLALEGLENSASHRRNMLLRKWRKVGIGLSQNKKREYYVVQIFGK
ncbi:CAP domain-containing protein [Candidatus Gracilibacteria bacterium]|nr:CAP domain-containing protein [Candidatus Gracilibacteria bacterium]